MAIRIIVDSATELDLDVAKKWGIDYIPLHVIFGEEEYLDVETIPKDVFYQKVRDVEVLPKTSQVTPFQYENKFREYQNSGDELLVITASSGLTGGFTSANIAAGLIENLKIHIVDSLSASASLGVLAEIAVRLRDEGKSAVEIEEELNKIKYRLRFYAVLDTLMYLNNGGRVKGELSTREEFMNMKPILTIRKGKFEVPEKIRGDKAAYTRAAEFIREDGIDTSYPIHMCHGNVPDKVEGFKETFNGSLENAACRVHCMGGTLGAHFGVGTLSIGFVALESNTDSKQESKE